MHVNKTKNLLVDRDTPVLRANAKPVPPEEISSQKIRSVVNRMREALYAEDDGVAIAAPQIGASLRLFIVRGSTIAFATESEEKDIPDMVFVNPEIVKVSKKTKKMEEGCLSLRYLYGEVPRHEKITIEAYDENGKPVSASATGLLAQIFQHEIDHLDGILFTDKAENIRDLPPTHNGSED
jgi:peptide deformylase